MEHVKPEFLLMAKLEEELSSLRKALFTFMSIPENVSYDLLKKTLDVLKRLSKNLSLIVLILEEVQFSKDKNVREEALIMSSEGLSLTSLLLPTLERVSPIFLDTFSVHHEPVVEKLEAIADFLENVAFSSEEESLEEVIQAIDDIIRALDYHISVGERCVAKIL